ncbi:MAG: hypothetical protein KC503_40185, partial [Myxococcales bacterium]|nr:hypothetical protein [Myxococcales bacterium]
MRTTLLLLAMSLLLGACGGSDDSNTSYQGATSSGTFFVKVATSPAPIPLNETFSADVAVYDSHDQTLMLDDVDVVLDGEMPQHGH